MTEREKMAQIIAEHLCPQGKAHKTLYGAARRCYSRNNFADCEKVSECVDALIEAGIGDVTEYKEIIRDLNTDVVAYRALSKADTLEQIIEGQKSLIDEYKHRAEVARQAILLSKWLAEKTRKDYPWQAWFDAAQKQAEKELAEEEK